MTAFARALSPSPSSRPGRPARWFAAGALCLVALVWTSIASGSIAWAAPAPDSFADLAAKLLPTVVNISTTQTLKGGSGDQSQDLPEFPPGSPFDEFFKNFMQRQGQLDSAPRKVTALGSGFIIDPDGLVVTNYHVIEDSDDITVILHDTKAYKAKVLGYDKSADLALLKISAPDKLPFIKFGDSDAMRVGDWVIAIGNPFGLGGTVTAGIVSARSRDINAGPYDDFLQTDAAINKGNSGGPLINMNGEVIGINSAIYSPSGGSIGIGFSIPSNEANPIISDLQKYGKWKRGWIGVRIQSVTDDIAESLGLKDNNGALVAEVTPGGPSEKAGIKQGDVILSFGGSTVAESRDLSLDVARTAVDTQSDITLWRNGQAMTLKISVGLYPDDTQTASLSGDGAKPKPVAPKPADPGSISRLGMKVSPLSPDTRKQFNISTDAKGVVVTAVDPSSAAADQGVRPGDVIAEISQEAVTVPSDVSKKVDAAKTAGHKTVLILMTNDSGSHFVSLRIDGKSGGSGPSSGG